MLLRAFGTLAPTLRLVGGLVPRYLTPAAPPQVPIRIELRRGATAITVTWPSEAADACAAWMRELLR